MQTLLLVRHAIAADRGPEWPNDDERPLTKKGEDRMRAIARRLEAMGETADLIVSSPLKRAIDTARILEREWKPLSAISVIDALSPGHEPADTIEAVIAEAIRPRIALVGHEPDLGELAAWLIGAKQPVQFKKGGVARIDLESVSRPREGELRWLATPRMLLQRG